MIVNNIGDWRYDSPHKDPDEIILADFGKYGLAVVSWLARNCDGESVWAIVNDLEYDCSFNIDPIRWAYIMPTKKEEIK